MHNREEFHKKLKEVSGVDNVYFQPPEKFLMKYPAIRYNFDDVNNVYAPNIKKGFKYGVKSNLRILY